MPRFTAFLFVLTSPLLVSADDKDDVKKEFKALLGSWKAVALEAAGKPLVKEAIPEFTYTFKDDGKATGKMAQSEYDATVSINPKATPKTMDNRHESGPQKGKVQYAIYKLEGDKLTVCITAPGAAEADRPKDFSTKDKAYVMFVFERVKSDK